jgi:hypothetical protein
MSTNRRPYSAVYTSEPEDFLSFLDATKNANPGVGFPDKHVVKDRREMDARKEIWDSCCSLTNPTDRESKLRFIKELAIAAWIGGEDNGAFVRTALTDAKPSKREMDSTWKVETDTAWTAARQKLWESIAVNNGEGAESVGTFLKARIHSRAALLASKCDPPVETEMGQDQTAGTEGQ